MKNWVWLLGIVLFIATFGGEDNGDNQPPLISDQSASVERLQQTQTPVTPTPNVPTTVVQAPEIQYLYVTGSSVNQRVGPNTTQSIIGQLERGTRVRLVQRDRGWNEIVSPLGNGWMFSDYLSTSRPTMVATQPRPNTRQVAVPSSAEIRNAKDEIIRQSIASYAGSCPCPYNRDRAGRRCGGRSAWSRPGGYSPICYESDVSASRVDSYFARRR